MNASKTFTRFVAVFAAFTLTSSGLVNAQDNDNSEEKNIIEVETLAELPVGITSFGGAMCDGNLFVFGGHDGEAHEYYRSGQNQVLYKLNLKNPEKWEAVHESPQGRQGLAMVAHNDKLYRLGGFEARNKRGDDQDLHSVATFDRFDPSTSEWTELAPMPEPCSSFDAVVMDDTLFVIGGWSLSGEGDTVWAKNAYSMDLSDPKAEWETLTQPPFSRRAMSVSFQGDNLYVIGGMKEKGGPTRSVEVYNTKTKEWSNGPELPGEEGMEGFGNSSFNVGGHVCVTTVSGKVYKLNHSGDAWEDLGSLETGRFFHRLLPISDHQFALIGGANMESGKATVVEVIDLKK